MLLNCGVGEDSWESLGLQGDPTSPFWRRSVLGVHWEDWFWSWNSNTLATWCEELTYLKKPWCCERLKAGEGRGWDGWMASPTRWTWVWVNSRSWWWTGRPGMLQFMGSQRVRHDWVTELNWTLIDFHILKNPCIAGINPAWSCCMSFLMCYWSLFAKILLRIFASMFISDICLQFSFLCCLWFWYQGDGGLVEWVWKWKCSLLCNFLKEF